MATKSSRHRKVSSRKKRGSASRIAAAAAEPEARPRSGLYDRANGFALGCFLTLIRFRFARPLFHVHRARILEFIEEEQLYPHLALSYGIELMEFMRTWCQETLAQVKAGELPPPPAA